ncbi:MAG: holo-ACP synthase [Victivallaceae bacterium]|nr:holo-ACP synthase [Victivallaceae bacterium]
MILGIGTDFTELDRFAKALLREAFARRVFTPGELARTEGMCDRRKTEFLCGRWAAKEAVAKALGCGLGGKASWTEIEVLPDDSGRPVVTLRGRAANTMAELGGRKVHLSITHDREHAAAFAVVED